jgi:hypothetical protein
MKAYFLINLKHLTIINQRRKTMKMNNWFYVIRSVFSINKISVLILLFYSFLIFSCSEKTLSEPETKTIFDIQGENGFAGTVDGTDAFIALLVADDEAIVYVCNGDEEISEWFRGAISDPTEISLTTSKGIRISAKFKGNSFEGDVMLGSDSTHLFTATPNSAEHAGIYRVYGDEATRDEVEAGWILNSEGDDRGALIVRSTFRKAPRIGDITDGTSNTLVVAEKSYPVFRFFLQRSSTGSFSIVAPNN